MSPVIAFPQSAPRRAAPPPHPVAPGPESEWRQSVLGALDGLQPMEHRLEALIDWVQRR